MTRRGMRTGMLVVITVEPPRINPIIHDHGEHQVVQMWCQRRGSLRGVQCCDSDSGHRLPGWQHRASLTEAVRLAPVVGAGMLLPS
eukprot:2860288-Rhodomonas_salina.4